MNNAWLTVSDLFSFGVTQLSDERLDGIESAGEMPAFKDAIASKIGAPKWPLAMKEIVRKVEATLQQISQLLRISQ